MKKLKALSVIFFAAIMLVIGTGVLAVQTYKVPEQNYLLIGVSLLISQNQNFEEINPLDPETIAKIENRSLTMQEIKKVKETLQDTINKGFEKWVTGQSDWFSKLSKASNETAAAMFFKFIDQNQEYRKLFKLYDQTLICENEKLMQERYHELDENLNLISLIISNGTIIREEVTTKVENGTTYTVVEREYALEINGTTQTAVKISVYDSEGRLLADPEVCIYIWPLMYWLQILWWGWLVWYGNDYYVYIHFPLIDTAWYLLDVWDTLETNTNAVRLPFQAAGLALNFLGPPIGTAASAACLAIERLIANFGEYIKRTILNACLFTILYNGAWGFRTLERLHYIFPWSFCPWDLFSSITYFIVTKDGLHVQVWPNDGWAVLNTYIFQSVQLATMPILYTAFVATFGWGKWVYMGAYLPIRQYTSYDGEILEVANTLLDLGSLLTISGVEDLAIWAAGKINEIIAGVIAPRILGFL